MTTEAHVHAALVRLGRMSDDQFVKAVRELRITDDELFAFATFIAGVDREIQMRLLLKKSDPLSGDEY